MAKALDLEEQEQLDQIKHFWRKWGNPISWLLIAVLGSYAGWMGYGYWQRGQASKAATLYDEVERAAAAKELPRLERSLADMKAQFGSTQLAQQSALLAAKTWQEQGKTEAATEALTWVANEASDKAYRDIAFLRLANLQLQAKAHEEALKLLDKVATPQMMGLAADLRGDVLFAKGQSEQAIAAYQTAWNKMADAPDYRRIVQAKLNALGIDPGATAETVSAK